MTPRLSEAFLSNYYAQAEVYAFNSGEGSDYAAVISDRMKLIKRFLTASPQAPRSGMAVDYGAGAGASVMALSKLGFDAIGVEISEHARQVAHDLFGIEMRDGDLSQFPPGSLALVTLFDVLEHLTYPRAFVDALRDRLQPGGVAMIGVPNFDSLDRLLMGARSKTMIFPKHINYFTRASLRRLLTDAGFTVRYVGSPPPYGVTISLGLRRGLYRLWGRSRLTRAMAGFLASVKRRIVYPLPNALVEYSGLFGQSLFIVAQKI